MFKMSLVGFYVVLFSCFFLKAQENKQYLSAWTKGYLDIHHINTGRGDATFAILPDGTTLLIDAGEMSEDHPRTTSSRNTPLLPNNSKRAYQWIADYIKQFAPSKDAIIIDFALITHYHDDHFGEVGSDAVYFQKGGYALTGIAGVGHLIEIKNLIDRGDNFPIELKSAEVQKKWFKRDPYRTIPTLKSYWNFIDFYSRENELRRETLEVGSSDQIKLQKDPESFQDFKILNVHANGMIATNFSDFSHYSLFSDGNYPGENPLSLGIRIDFGNFNYYTGGDISGIDEFGQEDFQSIESHVAPVIGKVDVAVLNHHGNRDSQSPYYVRSLQPRVWIQQSWTADHPGEEVFRRITSTKLYPGERDLFTTNLLQATKDVIGTKLNAYKSSQGHIVIRVEPKTYRYWVHILDDSTEYRNLKNTFGPYESR